MINAIGITDQSIGKTRQINEPVPVGVVASEPRHLQPEHKTDACERDFSGEAGKAGAFDRTGGGKAEVLVDDNDSILRTSRIICLGCECILPLRSMAFIIGLCGVGLATTEGYLS